MPFFFGGMPAGSAALVFLWTIYGWKLYHLWARDLAIICNDGFSSHVWLAVEALPATKTALRTFWPTMCSGSTSAMISVIASWCCKPGWGSSKGDWFRRGSPAHGQWSKIYWVAYGSVIPEQITNQWPLLNLIPLSLMVTPQKPLMNDGEVKSIKSCIRDYHTGCHHYSWDFMNNYGDCSAILYDPV